MQRGLAGVNLYGCTEVGGTILSPTRDLIPASCFDDSLPFHGLSLAVAHPPFSVAPSAVWLHVHHTYQVSYPCDIASSPIILAIIQRRR